MRQYSSTFELTRGFLIALLGSAFIYLNHWGFSHPLSNTVLALTSLYLLLKENKRVWFFSGFFIGLFWFWWIGLSFKHYNMSWAIPFVTLFISFTYGVLFWLIAYLAEKISSFVPQGAPEDITSPHPDRTQPLLLSLVIKSLGILGLSYIHPFGFDWFKPELVFVESYLGIEKWQFGIVLLSIVLSIWRKNLLFLGLVLIAYQPSKGTTPLIDTKIQLVSTHVTVKDKWDESLHPQQFKHIFHTIDQAIDDNKSLIILPESVFPIFINRSQKLIDKLQNKAKDINIVTGGLYWDGKTPRNSTYIFTKNSVTVANKVLLVPFGESNPLPDFLSDWINKIFYDGAIDYKAATQVSDYELEGKIYRNAICFEATSEKLYEGKPENMIVLSNNGWFMPSIEPTLQKLLLQYYSMKYCTTIYHSVNMSESYIIQKGKTVSLQGE